MPSGFNTGLSTSKIPAGIANSSFQTETDTYLAIICFIPFLKVPILLHSLAAAGWTAYIPAPQLPGHHHSFWNSS